MANSTEEGCVAEVYVEAPVTQDMSEGSDYEDEVGSDEWSGEDDATEEDAMTEDIVTEPPS